jgi:Leucine-rich repeat (LRR) protein
MALRNPRLFGLNVGSSLADIVNKSSALNSLNIPLSDLDVIRGSSDAGATSFDWISLSRLSTPIYRTLDRYINDTNEFFSVLNTRLGVDSILFGNLLINGSLDGKAVRYRYVEGTGVSALIKIADISTSRASSWSSPVFPALSTSPIFYGSRVGIVTGGSLEFKNPSSPTQSQIRLKYEINPEEREFSSELPTNKIISNINGNQVKLYVMKGIPLTFVGRFQSLSTAEIKLTSLINNVPPSWKISLASPSIPDGENLLVGGTSAEDPYRIRIPGGELILRDGNGRTFSDAYTSRWDAVKIVKVGSEYQVLLVGTSESLIDHHYVWRVNSSGIIFGAITWTRVSLSYKDQGGIVSVISNYNGGTVRERLIQFYYNPDNIKSISIPSAAIFSYPNTILPNLTTLSLPNNELRDFPNLTTFSPSLQILDLNRNPFFESSNPNERRLNANIISKIPTDLKELYLGNTFGGGVGINSIAERCSYLEVLNLDASINNRFYVKFGLENGIGNTIPNVPNTCQVYNVNNNLFTGIGTDGTYPSGSNIRNIKELDSLVSLNLASNPLSDPTFSISSSEITDVNISDTNLPIPDLSFKTKLTFFDAYDTGFPSTNNTLFINNISYKFESCNNLRSLRLESSTLTGPIPKFTNLNLRTINFNNTRLVGGAPSGIGSTDYVIPEDTFSECTQLSELRIVSASLLTTPIHPNVFSRSESRKTLNVLIYTSFGRTGGNIPDISGCSNLSYLSLYYNNFTGSIPRFSGNRELNFVDLSFNSLSGTIPIYSNLPFLKRLYLNNNKFEAVNTMDLPNAIEISLQNNLISGAIPSFSNCVNLEFLRLFGNRFSSYTPGSFATLKFIRQIDISSNLLSQQAVNNIVADLLTNYNSLNREGVSINLRGGNAIPNIEAQETILFLRTRGWSISYEGQ